VSAWLHAQAICLLHLQPVYTARLEAIFNLEDVKVAVFLQEVTTIILMIIIMPVWLVVQAAIPVMGHIQKTALLV